MRSPTRAKDVMGLGKLLWSHKKVCTTSPLERTGTTRCRPFTVKRSDPMPLSGAPGSVKRPSTMGIVSQASGEAQYTACSRISPGDNQSWTMHVAPEDPTWMDMTGPQKAVCDPCGEVVEWHPRTTKAMATATAFVPCCNVAMVIRSRGGRCPFRSKCRPKVWCPARR